jgi:sodium-dependent dicarboxylate transporter 2/3/5
MIPATLASSCAFVLPVSTPPNAIVYGSGRVPIVAMIKAGLVMEVVGLLLITILVFTLGAVVFDIGGPFPEWAVPHP